MPRIEGPSIKANVRTKATELDEPLCVVVTHFAQALKRPQPKCIHVPMVRLEVIADGRRGDDAALGTIFTQRVLKKLMPANPRPTCGAVPGVPLRTLTTNTHGSTR
jgi:hypothetical protein